MSRAGGKGGPASETRPDSEADPGSPALDFEADAGWRPALDSEADAGWQTGLDSEAEARSDAALDSEAEARSDTALDSEAEARSDTALDSEAEAGSETPADSETRADSEIPADPLSRPGPARRSGPARRAGSERRVPARTPAVSRRWVAPGGWAGSAPDAPDALALRELDLYEDGSGLRPLLEPPTERVRTRVLITLALVVLGLLAIGIAQTSFGRSTLRNIGIEVPSTAYTELYFPSPSTLPYRGHRGLSHQTVAFVIRNQGHRGVTYSWAVGTTTDALATGQTVLGADQQVTVTRRVDFPCLGPRARIQVTLEAPHEVIGYWEHCDP